jgi:hypothetical protein
MHSREIGAAATRQVEGLNDDAVRGRNRVVVSQALKSSAELGLPDPAIA